MNCLAIDQVQDLFDVVPSLQQVLTGSFKATSMLYVPAFVADKTVDGKKYYGSCMDTSCNDVLNIAKKKYHSVSDYIKDILKED